MLLCEDEARTKECRAFPPIVAIHTADIPPIVGLADYVKTCAASGCMHWRWGEPQTESAKPQADGRPPDGDGWWLTQATAHMDVRYQRYRREVAKRGYCGLAGRPSETS